jgi:hypothetical protein
VAEGFRQIAPAGGGAQEAVTRRWWEFWREARPFFCGVARARYSLPKLPNPSHALQPQITQPSGGRMAPVQSAQVSTERGRATDGYYVIDSGGGYTVNLAR